MRTLVKSAEMMQVDSDTWRKEGHQNTRHKWKEKYLKHNLLQREQGQADTQEWLYVDYTGKVFQNWRHSNIQEHTGL